MIRISLINILLLLFFNSTAQRTYFFTEYPETALLFNRNEAVKHFADGDKIEKLVKEQRFFQVYTNQNYLLSVIGRFQVKKNYWSDSISPMFNFYSVSNFYYSPINSLTFDTVNTRDLLSMELGKETLSMSNPGLSSLYDSNYYYYKSFEHLKQEYPEIKGQDYIVDNEGRIIMLNNGGKHKEWHFDENGNVDLILQFKKSNYYDTSQVPMKTPSLDIYVIHFSYNKGKVKRILFDYIFGRDDFMRNTTYNLLKVSTLDSFKRRFYGLQKPMSKIEAKKLFMHPGGHYSWLSEFTYKKGKISLVEKESYDYPPTKSYYFYKDNELKEIITYATLWRGVNILYHTVDYFYQRGM